MRNKTRATIFSSFTLLTVLLSVGCSGATDDPDVAASPSSSPPATSAEPSDDLTVIQPGDPGEGAVTGGPVSPIEGEANEADIEFVQMMIPHHAQAVEMTELARRHAVDRDVRRLAARIRAAQGPEILTMSAWLEEHGVSTEPSDGHGDHGVTQMAGMLTPEQMDDLAAARGRAFDRLFLSGMIAHHRGALEMADTVAVEGIDVRVSELAADIDLTQSTEIALMRDLL
jgi:uncharacterized protein (DUF305 family)